MGGSRYQDTIKAQFYGHTHYDEFIVYFDEETRAMPINIAYIGPSVTTYSFLNPSFRIYRSGQLNHRVSYGRKPKVPREGFADSRSKASIQVCPLLRREDLRERPFDRSRTTKPTSSILPTQTSTIVGDGSENIPPAMISTLPASHRWTGIITLIAWHSDQKNSKRFTRELRSIFHVMN